MIEAAIPPQSMKQVHEENRLDPAFLAAREMLAQVEEEEQARNLCTAVNRRICSHRVLLSQPLAIIFASTRNNTDASQLSKRVPPACNALQTSMNA